MYTRLPQYYFVARHKVCTLIRFVIDGKDMKQCEVVELGNR